MEENYLVVIPRRASIFLKRYFDENKIEYNFETQEYFPEGTPGGCTFRGVAHLDDVVGFKSKYTKEEIYNLLEELVPKENKFDKDFSDKFLKN